MLDEVFCNIDTWLMDGIHYNVILKSELNARCFKPLTEDLIISSRSILSITNA